MDFRREDVDFRRERTEFEARSKGTDTGLRFRAQRTQEGIKLRKWDSIKGDSIEGFRRGFNRRIQKGIQSKNSEEPSGGEADGGGADLGEVVDVRVFREELVLESGERRLGHEN
ncbi:hypothetical protein CRG98_045631 [Punica granatum]|uniref:Uncharacterized protein n=1 Tax=Punica granatum TaxID=22663 RepID=A0A2I0HQZ8_PUNGR|nr:hypothetical protein CRG98_045631 [Punica granatum]